MNPNRLHLLTKIIRWIRYILLALILVFLLFIFQRFGIVKIPPECKSFPPGSYVLVDRDWEDGRALQVGDSVVYRMAQDSKPQIGSIQLVINHQGYCIYNEFDGITKVCKPNDIQARILMVLFR